MDCNTCPKCGSDGYKEKMDARFKALAIKLLNSFKGAGFSFSTRDKFYITRDFKCGVKVGGYTHSCHIDTADYIILLFENNKTESFDKWELEEVRL